MFLIDDILLAPARGVLWIFEEIHKAAEEELANESEFITTELRNLYLQLETETITEKEFDIKEKILLDRLDAIEERRDPEALALAEEEELVGKQ
jgi:gas vesicle protein GvpG